MNKYLEKWDDILESIIPRKTAKDPKKIKTLAVFDFDDTLFHSPERPKNYKGNWHINIDSLTEPYVSHHPKQTMWNLSVVNTARRYCIREDAYCIMLTGRVGNIFEDRVKELLSQQKLNFDRYGFNEFGGDTAKYKISTIQSLIKKFPNFENLLMWDDDEEKINKYKEEFSDKEYKFKIYFVGQITNIINIKYK